MKLITSLFRNFSNHPLQGRSTLQLESLETRDVLSASPLPVLMVLPNRDYYYSHAIESTSSTIQQDSYYGRGVLKSTDGGQTWTLNQNTANQLANALQQTFYPNSPPTPIAGNETLTIGINHTNSDYAQWRQRFGSGL